MVIAMQPIQHQRMVNGIGLAYYEWGPEFRPHGTILLAHATGFHARCWDRVVVHLPGRDVIAVDMRGHGRSAAQLPVHWADFGADLAALVRATALTDVIGVGHSMGGHAMTQATAAEQQRFQRVVLIDPVIAAPDEYGSAGVRWLLPDGVSHPTQRRRNRWASPDEMFERFKDRPPFAAWDRDVLRDYCTHGLVLNANGAGYVLACPPDFGAAISMAARDDGQVYGSIR